MAWRVRVALWCLFLAPSGFAQERPGAAPATPAQAAVAEGVALLRQNRLPEARERFERAVALDPASADAHYMLGWVREQASDLAGAAAEYESALARAPGRAEVHDRLGFVRGEQGRTEEAVVRFREAVRLDPRLFDARYHLGATLWWTGDAAAALPELREAVRLDPAHRPCSSSPQESGAGSSSRCAALRPARSSRR